MAEYPIYIKQENNDKLVCYDIPIIASVKDVCNIVQCRVLLYQNKQLDHKDLLADLGIGPECVLEAKMYLTQSEFGLYLYNRLRSIPTLTFNYKYYSTNPNITIEVLRTVPAKYWNWDEYGLSSNPALTLKMLEEFQRPECNWNWGYISNNTSVTCEMVDKFPDKPWDWQSLSTRLNLSLEVFEKYYDKWVWNVYGISYNKLISLAVLKRYKHLPWNWGYISGNVILSIEMLEELSDIHWQWDNFGISSNRSLTVEIIKRFPNKPWSWNIYGIPGNPDLADVLLEQFPDKAPDILIARKRMFAQQPLSEILEKFPDTSKILEHSDLTLDTLINLLNSGVELNWLQIYHNPALTIDMLCLLEHKFDADKKCWGFYGFSRAQALTLEMIEKFPYKAWDSNAILRHKFSVDRKLLCGF